MPPGRPLELLSTSRASSSLFVMPLYWHGIALPIHKIFGEEHIHSGGFGTFRPLISALPVAVFPRDTEKGGGGGGKRERRVRESQFLGKSDGETLPGVPHLR